MRDYIPVHQWPKPMEGERKHILFGGDYNPEQWSEDVWDDDIRLMKKAGVNVVTLGVFAWALIEPEENVFDFRWIDKIVGKLFSAGIAVDMATATATPPRWLTDTHPEILPRDQHGDIIWPGGRQHWRPTSPVFRSYAHKLTIKMAEHFKNSKAIIAWHVSNELGCHNIFDYSEDASRAFQCWLKARYGTLDKLNESWNGAFWSQKFTSWDQVLPPRDCFGGINPVEMLDFKRFSSDALLDYYQEEAVILHRITPNIPVTTNLMIIENQTNPVDCFKFGEQLDFVSNDHYYLPDERHLDEMIMSAAITSGVAKKSPWFLMENSTSSVNWRKINVRKQPGEIIRDALVHVANGADAVCFFQWRQSLAGAEKFHSAMVPHAGENSKIYKEVCALGSILNSLNGIVGTTVSQSRLAMIYDYDSWWDYENGLLTQLFDYRAEFFHWFRSSMDAGVVPDVVGKESDWESYETVMFPATILVNSSCAARVHNYVEKGGNVVITYGTGISDDYDHVYPDGYPGLLKELLGIRVEEFSAIDDGHVVLLSNGWNGSMWADDISNISPDCDVIACVGDTADDRSLRNQPIITSRKVGCGKAFYVGTKLERQSAENFFERYIFCKAESTWGICNSIASISRRKDDKQFTFWFNRSDVEDSKVAIGRNEQVVSLINAEEEDEFVVLHPSGAAVVEGVS